MAGMGNDPYEDMTDEQVLARAAAALTKVSDYPVGSVERSIQWSVYESAKAELDLRMYGHILRKLRERRGEQ